jgi:hypothetical protein
MNTVMSTIEYILKAFGFYTYIQPVMSGFVVALAAVYISGRMLDIVHSWRIKNAIALSAALMYIPLDYFHLVPDSIGSILMIFSWVVILYVLIGFRIFDRVNKMQDKLSGEVVFIDEEGKERTLKRKAPPPKQKRTKK